MWLACLSLSIIPAFINTSLVGQGLGHCLKVSNAKVLLYDESYAENIATLSDLESKLEGVRQIEWVDVFSNYTGSGSEKAGGREVCTTETLRRFGGEGYGRIGDEFRNGIGWQDTAVLIFTSGKCSIASIS